MRLVFMGTPAIAEEALHALLAAGQQVAAVYTRADKPVGRKQQLSPPPVKRLAEARGIPVFQPKTLRGGEEAARLAALAPDLIVVVAYGLLLPPEILAIPKHGCVNLHVSRLPQYRGAAPIQWAVIHGEAETGISVMQMDEGLDTGAVLATLPVDIPPEMTAGELMEKVSRLGGPFLAETLAGIEAGRVVASPQQGPASYAPQLGKAMAALDFGRPAAELHNLVRGCKPWPLAWLMHEGKKLQVLHSAPAEGEGAPGAVLALAPLTVACGGGALALLEVRPEGKNAMTGAQWAMGRRLQPGMVLGSGE